MNSDEMAEDYWKTVVEYQENTARTEERNSIILGLERMAETSRFWMKQDEVLIIERIIDAINDGRI